MERKPHALQKERPKAMVSLQERLLQEAMQEKKNVTLILLKGLHIKGTIQGYDVYSILIEAEGKQQFVYKHAISTIRF
ncbi:RNA chaperone Hfq [Bacillus cereus]|uniref:RNA-binding protein Hfq n=3 Tax=Bacillus cereus group TaxID=86661 RepID=A0A9X7AZV5_BACTU|nr:MULTISPECIES: RNA chaperone Hfq [Bacillus]KIQ79417.1 RNA-binding protein [Bacillus sp. L_1B0_5]KIQ91349.1 RNA-binding protein [Bacillus sp. L_1B0_8]OUA99236.1 RNA chaperone Hfq [Bacillus thuringiensis serovar leesis]OUB82597.1 RNA chaperone Hfq [Bacillus thuringiensis serovar medellin]PEF36933.1 RNA chaperone Hfq [Bacillus wiedmannii]